MNAHSFQCLCWLSALGLAAAPLSQAAEIVVFSTDFEAGLPSAFSGAGGRESAQGFSAYGFGDWLLRNSTGGSARTGYGVGQSTTLTLTGLPAHDSLDLGFLLAKIDSWDKDCAPWGPDYLSVMIDGTLVFRAMMANGAYGDTSLMSSPEDLGWSRATPERYWNTEVGYNLGHDTAFLGIPHAADSVTIQWFADGSGWQGGADESFGLDNVSVTLHAADAVPDAGGTLALLTCGLGALAALARRRH